MGLRYRKSVSLFPGVRLNFGKTGMSVSTGVPGFRKTYHTSGRVTTSVGIPGTGLYYVDTKNKNKSTPAKSTRTTTPNYEPTYTEIYDEYNSAPDFNNVTYEEPESNTPPAQVSIETLKSIHKTCDDSVDWTEILVNPTPPDESYNSEMWSYYHSVAGNVLKGDIDTYLKLIYEVNPLDDLMSYGSGFEFGTDNSKLIEVEFSVNEEALLDAKSSMDSSDYNTLLQDYVCSMAIRVARDMFALLPISNTIVHALLDGNIILSVNFDRSTASGIKYGFIDPSDTVERFKHNMNFNESVGFSPVTRL